MNVLTYWEMSASHKVLSEKLPDPDNLSVTREKSIADSASGEIFFPEFVLGTKSTTGCGHSGRPQYTSMSSSSTSSLAVGIETKTTRKSLRRLRELGGWVAKMKRKVRERAPLSLTGRKGEIY